ncbi:MAG: hypothetical protein WC657_09140 [Candidatus Paceibacterota bacterium]|jgi:hypothetical protein
MATSITFHEESTDADESPIDLTEGEQRSFACTFWGVPSTVTYNAFYSGAGMGKGITADIFATGSATISGNTATLTLCGGTGKALVGKREYVVNVTATVSSEVFVRKFKLRVRRDEDL